MTRKCHNHTLQTNQWHREEESTNGDMTFRTQLKSSKQLSLPQKNEWKPRDNTKYCKTKLGLNTYRHKQLEQQQTMNKQQQNHCLRTDSSRSYWELKLNLLAKSSSYILQLQTLPNRLSNFSNVSSRWNSQESSTRFGARNVHLEPQWPRLLNVLKQCAVAVDSLFVATPITVCVLCLVLVF